VTEKEELKQLRAYKEAMEGKALNRAFNRLEQLLDCANYDPVMSVRTFRVIAECLICLKQEMGK
jgi:hypothetical protein